MSFPSQDNQFRISDKNNKCKQSDAGSESHLMRMTLKTISSGVVQWHHLARPANRSNVYDIRFQFAARIVRIHHSITVQWVYLIASVIYCLNVSD